jgi:hypothetical protein
VAAEGAGSGCGEQPDVQALALQDFIFPDRQPGQLRFKHGITRDVVYEATGLHERQALHRRISAALSARAGSEAEAAALHEQLAYHDAAAHDWAAAARHAEAAGDQALVASALDRAEAVPRRAGGWNSCPTTPSAGAAGWASRSAWAWPACSTPRATTCACCSTPPRWPMPTATWA